MGRWTVFETTLAAAVLGLAAAPACAQTAPPADEVDPELNTPLPPLATFDVTPVQIGPVTPPAAEPTVRYDLSIVGLDEIGVLGTFRELSALEDGEGDATPGARIEARIEEDTLLATGLMEGQGYYASAVDATTEPVGAGEDRVRVTLTATPGTRYTFRLVTVTTPPGSPDALIRTSLALEPGAPIVAADVEAGESRVLLDLPEAGYPFARIGTRDVLLDDATFTGDYTLPVTPGRLSSFGGVRLEGAQPFDDEHAAILARFDRGERWDSRLSDDYRQALIATGLFGSVAVAPVDTGVDAADGTRVVDVVATTELGPQRRLAANAGYGTGEGFRLEGTWTHRNLFPPEGALTGRVVAGTQEQRVGAEFRRSNAGSRDRSLVLLAEAARERRDAFDADSFTLSGRLSRDSTPIWQKKWTYSVGAELLASDERDFDVARAVSRRRTFFIAALPGQLGYDGSDSLLDPKRGFRLLGRLSPEASLQSGNQFFYARAQIDGSGYFPAGDNLVIAGRLRAGAIYGAERDQIAPSRRFYAGGGGSVRGFGYQDLGPRDLDGDPIGGRSLAEASLEVRYRFGNFGVVPFVDAGQLYTSRLPTFSDLRYGAGIGARYYTDFGPLRLDVATPLGRRSGEPKVALYISIGQAF